MYKIVGVDGRQYGLVGAEEIRRWLADKRVNAQTLAQSEGAQEWKPLGLFPEFAAELKLVPPQIAPPSTVASRAAGKIPAGICGILLGGFGVHKFILGYSGTGGVMLAVTLCSFFGGGFDVRVVMAGLYHHAPHWPHRRHHIPVQVR